jgi:hypothetical protein
MSYRRILIITTLGRVVFMTTRWFLWIRFFLPGRMKSSAYKMIMKNYSISFWLIAVSIPLL